MKCGATMLTAGASASTVLATSWMHEVRCANSVTFAQARTAVSTFESPKWNHFAFAYDAYQSWSEKTGSGRNGASCQNANTKLVAVPPTTIDEIAAGVSFLRVTLTQISFRALCQAIATCSSSGAPAEYDSSVSNPFG